MKGGGGTPQLKEGGKPGPACHCVCSMAHRSLRSAFRPSPFLSCQNADTASATADRRRSNMKETDSCSQIFSSCGIVEALAGSALGWGFRTCFPGRVPSTPDESRTLRQEGGASQHHRLKPLAQAPRSEPTGDTPIVSTGERHVATKSRRAVRLKGVDSQSWARTQTPQGGNRPSRVQRRGPCNSRLYVTSLPNIKSGHGSWFPPSPSRTEPTGERAALTLFKSPPHHKGSRSRAPTSDPLPNIDLFASIFRRKNVIASGEPSVATTRCASDRAATMLGSPHPAPTSTTRAPRIMFRSQGLTDISRARTSAAGHIVSSPSSSSSSGWSSNMVKTEPPKAQRPNGASTEGGDQSTLDAQDHTGLLPATAQVLSHSEEALNGEKRQTLCDRLRSFSRGCNLQVLHEKLEQHPVEAA